MDKQLQFISETLTSIEGITIASSFAHKGGVIAGSIKCVHENTELSFEVEILPFYPMQFHDSESIRFINKDFKKYRHVNADGSICVHTQHSIKPDEKIRLDIASLKEWISKYYIKNEQDEHYEHIIVPVDNQSTFLFTSVDYSFRRGDFGIFRFSFLSNGLSHKKELTTFIVQHFMVDKTPVKCCWSSHYQGLSKHEGIFIFIERPPVRDGRFAINHWNDLDEFVTQDFFKFLYLKSRERLTLTKIPLLLGYKISDNEIHWESVEIDASDFPNHHEKIPGTKLYAGRFNKEKISWGQTRNCSYKYFFGRGGLHHSITNSKILIIGIGALGSMVATTLTRGGSKSISLADHDIKGPENVCRSEYTFSSGVTSKVEDLAMSLSQISPFVEVTFTDSFMDIAKIAIHNEEWLPTLKQRLNEYDIIFDCSTDNDVAFILDSVNSRSSIFNISITNNAKELVCVVPPNLYNWMTDIYRQLGTTDVKDLYNPTGCWNPTFKASYNDIAVLVQFALKQINNSFTANAGFRSFYLSTSFENGFNIKLNQF